MNDLNSPYDEDGTELANDELDRAIETLFRDLRYRGFKLQGDKTQHEGATVFNTTALKDVLWDLVGDPNLGSPIDNALMDNALNNTKSMWRTN